MPLDPVQFSDLRSNLPSYLDACARQGRRFLVQRHSQGEAVLIGLADWREISETLDILRDPDLLAQLVHSERDIAEGRVRKAEDVFSDLARDDE